VTGNWLARYRAGEHGQVWDELARLGDAVREPEVLDEIQLVCDEMARRARLNVELIVDRLAGAGYRFHANNDEQTPRTPHIPPTAIAADHAAWLQERFGPIPLTLLSWMRIVGDVWLVGTHPDWPQSASADPLVIQVEGSHYPGGSIRAHVESSWQMWRGCSAADPGTGPFQLDVAPDQYHKDNVSGGGAYGIVVPDAHADAVFVAQTTMPFVQYLNWVFLHGGFPEPTGPDAARITAALAQDLLPL
jgi:hypothetical protein